MFVFFGSHKQQEDIHFFLAHQSYSCFSCLHSILGSYFSLPCKLKEPVSMLFACFKLKQKQGNKTFALVFCFVFASAYEINFIFKLCGNFKAQKIILIINKNSSFVIKNNLTTKISLILLLIHFSKIFLCTCNLILNLNPLISSHTNALVFHSQTRATTFVNTKCYCCCCCYTLSF